MLQFSLLKGHYLMSLGSEKTMSGNPKKVEQLAHKNKKGSTVEWFILSIIPILNIYWLWKAAQNVAGHDKVVKEQHESLEHMVPKDSTGKWFAVFIAPVLIGLGFVTFSILSLFSGAYSSGISAPAFFALGSAVAFPLSIILLIVSIFILYKMAVTVSGHDTYFPEQYEAVEHLNKRESTAKWFVFGIVPILNFYFLWKMSETISGHEQIISGQK
ncbi:hypothetical protein AKJ45_01090 [candidate division MSBL1 archaeon SCGC-AAA261F19]|uniref:DUF4234 domain-containing protein n=2 Tax=candidate division MSBL1 TaxID=215777 RepID=A0A133VB02_9EURY|nr:hypothetical protein AKJ43_01280 [candidate division MSBL1 archaeon SCGC-AAA261D19]KXB03631.1 hypothetical protein AKJ45_01090 [candidate division MSBL1 archaeon SCGC-AAA261F19]